MAFTITNGSDTGAAIYCKDSSPTITNCIITKNDSQGSGGGICCRYANPNISNCTISNNSAEYSGGGIYCSHSSPTITNCNITSNYADNQGGAIWCYNSSPTIINCIFSGNSAAGTGTWDGGGAVLSYRSNPTLTNCIFTGNSAQYGGAIHCFIENNLAIINCTFAGNSATNGNALTCDSSNQQYPSNIEITNCIIADGDDEIWNNDDSTITINYSDVQGGYPGQGNIDADPCFVAPGYWDTNSLWVDGDYHLLRTSPCVDAANDANVYTDIEGNIRPFDFPGVDNNGDLPEFDMGAYELVPIEAAMQFAPQTLNCDSRGRWVKAHFTFPEGYWREDVDVNVPAVAVTMGAESEYIMVLGNDDGLTGVQVGFDREAFCAHLAETGQIEVTVVGSLTTGQYFYGTDTIRIIARPSKPRPRNSKPRPRHLKPRHRR